MTLSQLQHFQTLAYVLHYTRAAEQLHIAQPSLSYSISELEKELGVKLFSREERRIVLTEYGKAFLPFVENALATIQEGTETLRQMAGIAPEVVRLAYFHSVATTLVPQLMKLFYADRENERIRFTFFEANASELLRQLKQGEQDLAFCIHKDESVEMEPIMTQRLYLTVPSDHPLAGKKQVRFEDFCREPMVMLEKESNLRACVDKIFQEHGAEPNTVFTVRECNAASQYISLHMGIAILPQVPATENDRLAVIPIEDDGHEYARTVYLAWSKSRPLPPHVKAVRRFILSNAESLTGQMEALLNT